MGSDGLYPCKVSINIDLQILRRGTGEAGRDVEGDLGPTIGQ
jgi:hypothetical protein